MSLKFRQMVFFSIWSLHSMYIRIRRRYIYPIPIPINSYSIICGTWEKELCCPPVTVNERKWKRRRRGKREKKNTAEMWVKRRPVFRTASKAISARGMNVHNGGTTEESKLSNGKSQTSLDDFTFQAIVGHVLICVWYVECVCRCVPMRYQDTESNAAATRRGIGVVRYICQYSC